MRITPFTEDSERDSQYNYSDPGIQSVEKSLCNKCQQYLDEGLRLTEHLKTCSPMFITNKDKVLGTTAENPIPRPSSLKKQPKVKIFEYKPSSNKSIRGSVKEHDTDHRKKKNQQESTREKRVAFNDEERQEEKEIDKENAINDKRDESDSTQLSETDISAGPRLFEEYVVSDESDSSSSDKVPNFHEQSWRNSQILFAISQRLHPLRSKHTSRAPTLSRHINNSTSRTSASALYKRKLSEAHDVKRVRFEDDDDDVDSSDSARIIKRPRKIKYRKKTKKHYLEIPSETAFKANVITEEDKEKPICARTRSSRIVKETESMDAMVEITLPKDVEKPNSAEVDLIPKESDERSIPLTRSKRKKITMEAVPVEPKQVQLRANDSYISQSKSIPKRPIKSNDDKEKNIPRKKPSKIIIPPKNMTQRYPTIPSPIHTITRSKGNKLESLPELPSQESDSESPIENLSSISKQINHQDLVVLDTVLGEGQVGMVHLAKYKGLLVACKSKRANTRLEPFYYQIQRELKYAADLSVCRYINKYIGWIYCPRFRVEHGTTDSRVPKLYVIQKYIPNGDARSYLDGRDSIFRPSEAVQAAICLFSALTDAHSLGIGIVDLKLENFLIDSSGAGWLTDFGSCIEFFDRDQVDLDEEEVAWTTNVAAPEMINAHTFSKASDVFMATLIVAELLTVELSDKQFYTQVLKRRRANGDVQFSPALLHKRYSAFFPLLKSGLANNPKDRPCARKMLERFISLRANIV